MVFGFIKKLYELEATEGVSAAKDYYKNLFFNTDVWNEYKKELDAMLIADRKDYLIYEEFEEISDLFGEEEGLEKLQPVSAPGMVVNESFDNIFDTAEIDESKFVEFKNDPFENSVG